MLRSGSGVTSSAAHSGFATRDTASIAPALAPRITLESLVLAQSKRDAHRKVCIERLLVKEWEMFARQPYQVARMTFPQFRSSTMNRRRVAFLEGIFNIGAGRFFEHDGEEGLPSVALHRAGIDIGVDRDGGTRVETIALEAVSSHGSLAEKLPWYSVIPFVLLLLALATLPLVAHQWWERLRSRAIVTGVLSLPILVFLLIHGRTELAHSVLEYLAFIALLGSLFVISGGIVVSGDIRATPAVNTGFLAVGAVLANLIGTTGASMLLIRPLLRTNSERKRIRHLPIFFIFVVSNVGGCLTPLGDPPLFLGYLRGVPFSWTLTLFPEWLFMVSALLAIFFLLDTLEIRREAPESRRKDLAHVNPIRLRGAHNLLFLLGVLGAVFLPMHWRILAMNALAAGSYFSTKRSLHLANHFSFFPINEVAILFSGIFVTVVPALVLLEVHGRSLGVDQPWQYFWLTGILSSFLDNAPTYLTFTSLALGQYGLSGGGSAPLLPLVHHEEGAQLLRAISLGAVFMGANTYIGNGPNFMVKSIVENRRMPMPGFFGFIGWSAVVLLPLFLIVTLVFLT
jgi:Na+/H+ antiporter NhaD/arsenite permease-like protein